MATNFLIGYPDIPYHGTVSTLDDADTLTSNTDLVSGAKAKVTQLTAATTGQTDIYIDRGSAQLGEYVAVTRAKLLKASGVSSLTVRSGSVSFLHPSTLASIKLWIDGSRGVTADSANRVSAIASRAGSISFTQGTAANKPLWTRADAKENLILYSEDLSNATYWNSSSYPTNVTNNSTTAPDGTTTPDTITVTGATSAHGVRVSGTGLVVDVPAGLSYTMSVYVKRNNHDYLWIGDDADSINRGVCVNINSGTIYHTAGITASSITSVGSGWYRVSITATKSTTSGIALGVWLSTSANNASPPSFAAAGEAVYAWGFQGQMTPSADSTYLATTSDIQVAGVNGQRALFFDGANDYLSSTTDLDQVFAAGAKTVFIVAQNYTGSATGRVFDSVSGVAAFSFNSSSAVAWANNDGAADTVTTTAVTRGTTGIIEARHESGTIYIKANNGTEGSTASGDTTSMNSDMRLGADGTPANYLRGKLCEVLIFNTALSSGERTNLYNYLVAKWQTTPLYEHHTVQSATFTGPGADDLIAEFSSPATSRYWVVSFDSGVTSSKRPFAHLYLGSFFDLGRDPLAGRIVNLKDVGDRGGRIPYTFEFFWEGITNAKRESFETTIGKYTGEVFYLLYADSYDYVLNGHEPLYVRIASYSFTPSTWMTNSLNITFEEVA